MPAQKVQVMPDTNTISQILRHACKRVYLYASCFCLLLFETENIRRHNWPTHLFEEMNSNNRNIPSDNDDGSFLVESYSQGEGGHYMDSGSWRHPHEESYDDEYVEGMLSLSLCSPKIKYDE